MDIIKIKITAVLQRNYQGSEKATHRMGKKHFQIYQIKNILSDKHILSRIYIELAQFNSKKNKNILKMGNVFE